MICQQYPEEFAWVSAKFNQQPGDFLGRFLAACLTADAENYELLRPAVRALMDKYPVERAAQTHD